MKARAERTLVKSPPELWELADDHELMSRWAAVVLGEESTPDVWVTFRKHEQRLGWRTAGRAAPLAMELELAEKGFGTAVTITARTDADDPETMLESLLDELGSTQRRPFAR
jgi:hypothetical protein